MVLPNYVANPALFWSNFMSRITLSWWHISTLQKVVGDTKNIFKRSVTQSRPIWIKSKDLNSLTLELNFHFGVVGERWHQGLQSSVGRWTNYRLSAVRQRHLADERYYYWDREYTSLSSVHLPTEFWRPWWRLPRSTSKCKIGFRGLTAETFWFDPNWSILWGVVTLEEMECSKKKRYKSKEMNFILLAG